MTSAIVPMPVTIEQVAAVVRNMSRAERQRLLELVPDLLEKPSPPRTRRSLPKANPFVEELRQELQTALGGQPLAPDAPFLDNMTVGDYLDLADSVRAELWELWTTQETSAWREVDVYADAIPA